MGYRNPLSTAEAVAEAVDQAADYTDARTPTLRSGAGTYSTNAAGDINIAHNFQTSTGVIPNIMICGARVAGAVDTHICAVRVLGGDTAIVRVYYNGAPVISAAGVGLYFIVAGFV